MMMPVRIYILVFSILLVRLIHAQNIFDAVRSGDTLLVDKLYKIKPEAIHSKNENGFTPLIIATYRSQERVAHQLINLGVSVNENSPEGPAIVAAAFKSNIRLVKLLLQQNANVNLANEEGVTALMYATLNHDVELVKILLDAGAVPSQKSKWGQSAVLYAKQYEYLDLLSLFGE
jgi:hypothetical protein